MDFENKLQQAIERGQRRGQATSAAEKEQQLSESQRRSMHNDFRLKLSDSIENCLRGVAEHFPGFEYETIYGERGWGGAISRDDLGTGKGRAEFSRLEVTVRPLSEFNVVDISAKGTIRNKELFTRSYFEPLESASAEKLTETVESWSLEYAELFAGT